MVSPAPGKYAWGGLCLRVMCQESGHTVKYTFIGLYANLQKKVNSLLILLNLFHWSKKLQLITPCGNYWLVLIMIIYLRYLSHYFSLLLVGNSTLGRVNDLAILNVSIHYKRVMEKLLMEHNISQISPRLCLGELVWVPSVSIVWIKMVKQKINSRTLHIPTQFVVKIMLILKRIRNFNLFVSNIQKENIMIKSFQL